MKTFLPGPGPLTPAPPHPADAPADAWALVVAQRGAAGYYAPPAARTSNVFDPAANTFADWTPPPTQSRTQPNYTPPRASITPPSDTSAVALDTWAQSVFGRAAPYYAGQRAVTISVWDPATNTFADWTPAALLSRAVKAYSPPAAQPRVAWGESVITDQFAPLTLSRMVGLYRGPLARITNVFDPAANTFADWTPAALISRASPFYRAPAAQPRVAWGESIVTDQFAPLILSRASRFYTAPAAQPRVAWGESIVTDAWIAAAISRSVPLFRSPAAFLARVYDQPPVVSSTDYVAAALSRQVAAYRGSYSAVMGAADQARVTEPWTAAFVSRQVAAYSEPGSLAVASADEAIESWAQLIQSPRGSVYVSPRSVAVSVFDTPAVAATWAQVSQSLKRARLDLSQSRFIAPLGPDTPVVPGSFVALVQSRQRANYAAPRALFVPAFFALAIEFPPGGGGFGAEASAAWLRRYHAAYEGRYRGGYKSTLRKAK